MPGTIERSAPTGSTDIHDAYYTTFHNVAGDVINYGDNDITDVSDWLGRCPITANWTRPRVVHTIERTVGRLPNNVFWSMASASVFCLLYRPRSSTVLLPSYWSAVKFFFFPHSYFICLNYKRLYADILVIYAVYNINPFSYSIL